MATITKIFCAKIHFSEEENKPLLLILYQSNQRRSHVFHGRSTNGLNSLSSITGHCFDIVYFILYTFYTYWENVHCSHLKYPNKWEKQMQLTFNQNGFRFKFICCVPEMRSFYRFFPLRNVRIRKEMKKI